MSALCLAVICSQAARFALMSSRIAACGQPPVSIAWMRSGSSAECCNRLMVGIKWVGGSERQDGGRKGGADLEEEVAVLLCEDVVGDLRTYVL